MHKLASDCLLAIVTLSLTGISPPAFAAGGCSTVDCHQGIANIKPDDHEMMRTIKMIGSQHGDPDGCIMCHGGNQNATTTEEAHKGIPATLEIAPGPKAFYPDPGSIWIAENSCGACHHDDEAQPLADLKIGDEVPGCIECHDQPGEKPKGRGAPKLSKSEEIMYHAEALHDNCKGCHKAYNKKNKTKAAPATCGKCHAK